MSLLVLRYTVLRLALFGAALGLLALAGARGILLVALTVAVSLALSYLLLGRQRDALAAAIAARVGARRPDSDEAIEDAADEARRAHPLNGP